MVKYDDINVGDLVLFRTFNSYTPSMMFGKITNKNRDYFDVVTLKKQCSLFIFTKDQKKPSLNRDWLIVRKVKMK